MTICELVGMSALHPTDEPWHPVEHGRLHIFAYGTQIRRNEIAA